MLRVLEASFRAQVLKNAPGEEPESSQDDHAWRALLDGFPHPVALFDRQLRHTYANYATELATGIPSGEFIGKKMRDLGHPEIISRQIEENVARTFSSPETRDVQVIFDGPAGTVVYHCRFCAHFNSRGEVDCVMVISRDVTRSTAGM